MGDRPFRDFKPEQIIRTSFDGFKDPEQHSFSILTRSPLIEDAPAKANIAFSEYLDSYLLALASLGDTCEKSNQEDALLRTLAYPPAPVSPALFICHHIVELSLKQILFIENEKIKQTHKLNDIWRSCSPIVERKAGIHLKKSLWKFVSFVDELDPSSTRSRYPIRIERNGLCLLTEKRIYLINVKELSEDTDLFVKTLRKNKLIPEDDFSQNTTRQVPSGTAIIKKE